MLKIAFLTGEYPPMQGGIADHTAYLVAHLQPLEVQSSIIISHPFVPNESDKISFFLLPDWGGRCWLYLSHYLKTACPDLLHIQYQAAAFDLGGWVNWLPWYLKKRGFRTRLVTTFHDLRIPYIFPKAGLFRWRSILALARYSDAVICTNQEDLQTLSSQIPHLTCQHIPLGSNVEPNPPTNFDRSVWRQRYGANESTFLMAYFGFLNESKGGEELIESLALLRQQDGDVRLLLIGGEVGQADPTNVKYAQRVRSLIKQYQLNDVVYATGYIDLREVSANLLAADAVVMPYRDGVSFRRTTLIAALRHGCAIISTSPSNPSFVPEIRHGENMLLTPPNEATALAQTIVMLAKDKALQQKLKVGAKQLGYSFEWSKIATDTVALYRQLLNEY